MTGVQTCALPICFPVTIATSIKNAEVAVIEAQKKKLENERDDLEQKLVKILARDMAASKVLSEVDPSEEDDIVKAHLSKSISKTLAAYVEKLRSEYVARQKMIAELEQKIRQIKNSMAELENKKIRLAKGKSGFFQCSNLLKATVETENSDTPKASPDRYIAIFSGSNDTPPSIVTGKQIGRAHV